MNRYEDRSYRALLERERYYAREMQKQLKKALDELRGKMAVIYERYARDGKLSRADMTRYNRYATMEKQMLVIVNDATRKNLRTIDRLRPEQYGEAFFRYAWAVDQFSGVRLSWGVLNREAVIELLANDFYRISRQRYGMEARLQIRNVLAQGVAQGYSYPRMSRELRNTMNILNWKAMRILRTEGQDVMNAGQNASYTRAQEQGIQGDIIWDATLDLRTREQHQQMDGKARDKDGLFTMPNGERTPYPAFSGLSASNRINCRCNQRFQVEGYEPAIRRSRDEGVVPYQTYDKWKKDRPTWK